MCGYVEIIASKPYGCSGNFKLIFFQLKTLGSVRRRVKERSIFTLPFNGLLAISFAKTLDSLENHC